MGYFENFVAIRHLILVALIGGTFTSAEPPVLSAGFGRPSWSMQKADMIYESSTVERMPRDSPGFSFQPGWTPYQGSGSGSSSSSGDSYQPNYRPQNTYTASSSSAPRPSVTSFDEPTVIQYKPISTSIDADREFTRSGSSFYSQAATSSHGSPSAPDTNYGAASQDNYGPPQASEKEVRFVIHKPGEEDEVRNTLTMQYSKFGDMISFLNGPLFKFQKKQKLFLPPKPKTIVFVLLRTPEVSTETEVIPSEHDPKPEVRIIYQKPEGVKTQHYAPDAGGKPTGAKPGY